MLPLYVDISDKRIVVFGGGDVAERKINQILEMDGRVVEVYSRDFTTRIEEMRKKGEVHCFRCDLWKQDLGGIINGAFLIVICTEDEILNNSILKEAKKFNMLINYGRKGDVFMSSVVKRGGFLISISTEGKGPAMAKYMKEKISHLIGTEEEKMLQIQLNLRRYLKDKGKIDDAGKRKEILSRVLNDPECWEALNEPTETAEKIILKIIGYGMGDR